MRVGGRCGVWSDRNRNEEVSQDSKHRTSLFGVLRLALFYWLLENMGVVLLQAVAD